MWLFTETGFVSVVQDPQDKNKMVVRSRDKVSLEPLVASYATKVIELKNRDYPYRVFLTRQQFVDWLVELGETLEYTNYKTRAGQTRGHDFTRPLHDVWSTMLQLEDLGKPPKSQKFNNKESPAPYRWTQQDWADAASGAHYGRS
jgi:hypothetical protein